MKKNRKKEKENQDARYLNYPRDDGKAIAQSTVPVQARGLNYIEIRVLIMIDD
jgi:hypothetical protein